jgi:hypothetical protein
MTRHFVTRRFALALALVLLAGLPLAFLSGRVNAGQDTQQTQQQQGQQQKPKKKGGFFSGLKEVTGSSSAQTTDTASAGAKGVGEGEKIGNVTPSPADRQAVTAMENYSVPAGDLSKFIEDGHLKPKQ